MGAHRQFCEALPDVVRYPNEFTLLTEVLELPQSCVRAGQCQATDRRDTMIRLMTIAITLTLSAPAFASDESRPPVTIVDCREGGCKCTQSPISLSDLEMVFGEAPAGMEPILVDFDGDMSWSHVPVDDIDIVHGGDGSCSAEAPLQPEDGVWSSHSRFVSVSCGPATALMRASGEAYLNTDVAPRVVWGGVFDGSIYQRAWMAANPDVENVAVPFTQTSVTVSEGSATYSAEGGSMLNTVRFELLSPRLFRADYHMSSHHSEAGPCGWHIRSMVRKVGD
jgi:hypothetical protein